VIAVTHDRYFLDNAAEWILELDRGYGIPWKGQLQLVARAEGARLEIEAKQEAARIKAMHKELEWVRQNPRAAGEEQGAHRALRRARLVRASRSATRRRRSSFPSPSGSAIGDRVQGREQGYGDRLLIDDLSFKIPPGAIVGIIGPTARARRRCSA
jgi:sulfate-transporting ATPase